MIVVNQRFKSNNIKNMELPLNNRVRAEYRIERLLLTETHEKDGLIDHMNRQLISRIVDEIIKTKPDIIESSDEVSELSFYKKDFYTLSSEVFVFTRKELNDFITKVQLYTLDSTIGRKDFFGQ